MSALVRGKIVDSNLSRNAKGGTEQMRDRLLRYVDSDLLKNVSIHFSRIRNENMIDGVNIFYAHDLAADPENAILANDGYKKFNKFVFVSYWQRDQYMMLYGIPHSRCTVIENAVELEYKSEYSKPKDMINLIYHTTPHRGLQLLYPIFNALSSEYKNLHLDVYSSFGVYGWKERDKPYEQLFRDLTNHPNITYHGARSNAEVLEALDKAHIFLYPNIWQETSCIAMIEAIKSRVVAIHPNLAALPETASECTIMYDYDEDYSCHANKAYKITKSVIDREMASPGFLESFTSTSNYKLHRNSVDHFKNRWNNLLHEIALDPKLK